jgi:DNA-binding MarR family transcriptional regulator
MKSAERNKKTYLALQQFYILLDRRLTSTINNKTLLTYAQFQVLKIIADSHLSTQDMIASTLGISQPAVSKQVRLLLDRELIHATSAASDRRKTILHVTARGKVQLKKALVLVEEQLEDLLGTLSAKNRISLERSLNTLTVALLLSVDG